MEISKREREDFLELAISGRLDAYWADFLSDELSSVVQQGFHQIRLDLADVAYVSSAGIGVLLTFHQELGKIEGSIQVTNCSDTVKQTLEMTGLTDLLFGKPAAAVKTEAPPAGRTEEREGTRYEILESPGGSPLNCRIVGDPDRLASGRFEAQDSQTVELSGSGFGLGLGALGQDFESCSDRFGEFLAVESAAIYQPTDGSGIPDYLVSVGESAPAVSVLYGLVFDGSPSQLIRFETTEEEASIGLSRLVGDCLNIVDTEAAAFVVVAESTGMIGAALKRSPASEEPAGSRFDHPEIRRWLSFSPERIHRSSVGLLVGVAVRNEAGALASMVRPLSEGSPVSGHFHAAVFSYGPLQRGRVDLKQTVTGLFQTERALAVLHLLADDRAIVGAGESEFSRGACWVGPIGQISKDGSA